MVQWWNTLFSKYMFGSYGVIQQQEKEHVSYKISIIHPYIIKGLVRWVIGWGYLYD